MSRSRDDVVRDVRAALKKAGISTGGLNNSEHLSMMSVMLWVCIKSFRKQEYAMRKLHKEVKAILEADGDKP